MAIILRAASADSNSAGASPFCSFAIPAGIQNGDVAIVGIAAPAGVMVTPPDSNWTPLASTDPTQFAIQSFWKVCLNEQSTWAFALSSSAVVAGTCLVYGNTDLFAPIEVSVAQLTAASTSHGVGSVMARQVGEELALFIAGAASGTYTPPSGMIEVARKQQSSVTIEAQHQGLQNAGIIAAFSETFSTSAQGVSLIIVVSPSFGTMSATDAYNRLFENLPPGLDDLLNFTPNSGDFWKLFSAIGLALKMFVFDLYDLAKLEIVPYLSRYKLPDWEGFFALLSSSVTQSGTIPQRQAQVLSAFRRMVAKSANFATVKATLGPLLGYFPTTPVQIIEPDISALRLMSTYGFQGDISIANNATGTATIYVNDGGTVSKAGAQLELTFSAAPFTGTITLTGPDATSVMWTGTWSTLPLRLYAPGFSGKQILGTWTLSVTNHSGSSVTLFDGDVLFAQGIARGQQTGAAVFLWGVLADSSHVGENGTAVNIAQAQLTVRRLSFDHARGFLYLSNAPEANITSGPHAALADMCCCA